MEFYTFGTDVIVKGVNIKAKIKGVCVRGENNSLVEYDIVYWVNGKRETEWVKAFEIELPPETKPMGFKSYPQDNKPLLEKP